jgi:hypothetical protein
MTSAVTTANVSLGDTTGFRAHRAGKTGEPVGTLDGQRGMGVESGSKSFPRISGIEFFPVVSRRKQLAEPWRRSSV